jgi:hypothetical protein
LHGASISAAGTILLLTTFATYYFFPWLFRRKLHRYFEALSQREDAEGAK